MQKRDIQQGQILKVLCGSLNLMVFLFELGSMHIML